MLRTKVHYASYRGAPGFIVKHIDPFPTKTNSKPFRAMVFRQGTDGKELVDDMIIKLQNEFVGLPPTKDLSKVTYSMLRED